MKPLIHNDDPSITFLPHMQRGRFPAELADSLTSDGLIMVRSLEQLSVLLDANTLPSRIILHNSLPIWNSLSYGAFCDLIGEGFYFVSSYELSIPETKELYRALPESAASHMILPLYGRIPLMVSAGCVKHTRGKCDGQSGITYIKDRKNISFPVENDCDTCINIIYNSVPYSGHMWLFPENLLPNVSYLLEFTTESSYERQSILSYYNMCLTKREAIRPPFEYTTAHLKKRVQ